jgi:hypothetical protein
MRRGALPLLCGLCLAVAPARASEPVSARVGESTSCLAPALLAAPADPAAPRLVRGAAEVPELWLAQRGIEREWGPSEDSLYRTVELKGWKLEGLALGLSAAVPGAGQLYVGEGSGWLFLALEALGWAGRAITLQRGDELKDEAAAQIGDPLDPASSWSFERYTTNTGDPASELRVLWEQDRDAFYESISRDTRYQHGFSGPDPSGAYDGFRGAHESSQDRYRQSRRLEMALLVNHVVAAFDALRAARAQNMPLRRDLELRLSGRAGRRGGELRAALVRSF